MTPILTDADQTNAYTRSGGPDPMAQLRAYWEGLRVNDAIPSRAQISPRGIEAALASTFLLERVAPGIARFRIAGMDLADVMGMEVRGLPFSSMFCPAVRNDMALRLEQVFQSPAILTMDLVAERGIGRPALSGQLLALPLRDDQGRIAMALGCIVLSGKLGRSPRRFEIARSALTRLATPTLAQPRPAPTIPAPKLVENAKRHAFAEAAAQYETAQQAPGKPYLRLVK